MFRAVLCLALCTTSSGCLAIAYPTDTVTPTVVVPDSDVSCFKTSTFSKGPCVLFSGGFTAGWEIQRVPIEKGKVRPLEEKHFTYWVGGPLVSWHDRRWWSLYLYRPGYEMVEVEPGMAMLAKFRPEALDVEWKPLTSADDQAKVIDKLAGRGLWNNATVEFRHFCADEYERLLVRFPMATDFQKELWRKKADDLRKIGTGREPVGQPIDYQQLMRASHRRSEADNAPRNGPP